MLVGINREARSCYLQSLKECQEEQWGGGFRKQLRNTEDGEHPKNKVSYLEKNLLLPSKQAKTHHVEMNSRCLCTFAHVCQQLEKLTGSAL